MLEFLNILFLVLLFSSSFLDDFICDTAAYVEYVTIFGLMFSMHACISLISILSLLLAGFPLKHLRKNSSLRYPHIFMLLKTKII